jgi:phosphatidylserine decarboxylase
MGLELAWGQLRRWWLRTVRPGYVASMRTRRQGHCPGCVHDIIDARDLKFYRNVCGYWFEPNDDSFHWRSRLPITRMGWGEVLVFAGGPGLSALVLAYFAPLAALAPGLVALFVVMFFRHPPRRVPQGAGVFVSPADGTVTDVEEVEWLEGFEGPALKIGIYLSLFNVHVNRNPETARVIEVAYFPGQFLNTRRRASADVNEQCWTLLECTAPPYHRLLVKQIAGTFARRIVCEARPGEVLARGQPIGMIKFGSRTELYLSREPGLRVTVQPGDQVRGGSSVVARYGS